MYDSLVHLKPDGTFEPWLAKSWKVSDDALSYPFVLRDDVTFQDGTPFDAQAVKANFDHVVAPATKSRNAKTLLGPYQRTDVVDKHTVVVHLSTPYSPLLGGRARRIWASIRRRAPCWWRPSGIATPRSSRPW